MYSEHKQNGGLPSSSAFLKAFLIHLSPKQGVEKSTKYWSPAFDKFYWLKSELTWASSSGGVHCAAFSHQSHWRSKNSLDLVTEELGRSSWTGFWANYNCLFDQIPATDCASDAPGLVFTRFAAGCAASQFVIKCKSVIYDKVQNEVQDQTWSTGFRISF